MSTIQTVLLMLAFLTVCGIVGHIDYDDAVTLESTRQHTFHNDCAGISTPSASLTY